jgi:hypothetical protein
MVGRAVGGRNFTDEQRRTLLDLIEELRPRGRLAWERLALRFNANFTQQRKYKVLQAQFKTLRAKRKKTGKQFLVSFDNYLHNSCNYDRRPSSTRIGPPSTPDLRKSGA